MNRSKASLVDRIEWLDMKESTPCLMVRLVMMYCRDIMNYEVMRQESVCYMNQNTMLLCISYIGTLRSTDK